MFLHQSTNIYLEIKYFKLWYLLDMGKKLVIAVKTLGWSKLLNTQKITLYLANHDIQNIIFYMLAKHLTGKNIMVFFNTKVLSQNA
jgi:hypothetical protein